MVEVEGQLEGGGETIISWVKKLSRDFLLSVRKEYVGGRSVNRRIIETI